MSSIEDWRKSNLHKPQQPLPGLLSRLSIIPASERLPAPDDSALDTRSESSMGESSSHHLPLSPGLTMSPVSQPSAIMSLHHPLPPASPSAALSPPPLTSASMGNAGPARPRSYSLSKSNTVTPGRRSSIVSHAPSSPTATTAAADGGRGLSRLTIVRAPSQSEGGDKDHTVGSLRSHRRSSSGGSAQSHSLQMSSLSSSTSSLGGPGRMSFAFSSFGAAPPTAAHGPGTLSSSNSSSSSLGGGQGGLGGSTASLEDRPRLLSGRRASSGAPGSLSRSPSLTGAASREDARDLTPREVLELSHSISAGQHARQPTYEGGMEPVEFQPMEDEILLPFDDRPGEVRALLDSDKNAPLVHLLSVSFENDGTPSPPSEGEGMKKGAMDDPTHWTYPEFVRVLTETGRDEMDDGQWVHSIGLAVKSRSEPLWEKLKGCLGIDEDDLEDEYPHSVGGGGSSAGLHEAAAAAAAREYDSVWMEGLVESERGGTSVSGSDFGHSEDDHGGSVLGVFSPEAPGMSVGLPPSSAMVSEPSMEAIGEEDEEPLPSPGLNAASAQSSRQTSTETTIPSLITTLPSPPEISSIDHAARPSITTALSGGRPIPGATADPHSPGGSISPPTSPFTPRSKSFIGVSILSSSPAFSTQDLADVGTKPEDLIYGGNHKADPMSERGPGSPLFPTSFASLSLRPNAPRRQDPGPASTPVPRAVAQV